MDRGEWAAVLGPGVVPGLVMLGVASVGATRPVLSWDEVSTAEVAARSPGEIWALLHNVDAVLAPYYLLMHAWTGVAGASAADLRAPSVVAMAAAVGLAGELGRRLFSPLAGLTGGLLLCLLPNTSRYAAEARPYAFAVLFAVLGLVLLHAALRRPGPLRWGGYALAVLALGLSHVVALTTLAAHAVAAGAVARRERSWRPVLTWAAAAGLAVLAAAPLIVLGLGQRDTQLHWLDPLTAHRLRAGPRDVAGSAEAAWLLIGLALAAVWRRREPLVVLTVLGLAPVAVVAAVSLLVEPYWVPRYLLVVLVPLALLAGVTVAGAAGAAGRAEGAARVLLVLVVAAVAAYPGQRAVRTRTAKAGADYATLAAVVERGARPGDVLLYQGGQRALRAGVEYYLRGARQRPPDVLVRRSAARAAALNAEEDPDVAGRLAAAPRVWLVVASADGDPVDHKPSARAVLRQRYAPAGVWRVHGATVALYQRRP
ncbi:glycosyltransferase family 39 protein [Spirilliplanes yamanashiensis]|uniref:Glycosyltransferase RgtA/B/C/D-like domain-containing protein n=1 Tax=Spirilliplanes yamanashiensis TaxID=42233 RepID=A0A8J3Y9E8_9ACTN|nr:glycosyltransferase family 39 protein [Spirilliplanes yamanashiensis]MDP9815563.1 mannosyltransferase [Spirilliplanes yamanashiensis]GIJ03817.1 hypothetical protein Sya03_31690 [Spirilliplanes yamanashiensis]